MISSLASRNENSAINGEESRIDLGDARLDKRFASLLERFSGSPASSIPQAVEGEWKEIKGVIFVPIDIDKKDKHGVQTLALQGKVKYVRLVRGRQRWYAQLCLSGLPK